MSAGIGRQGFPYRGLAGWVAVAALLVPGPAQAVGTAFTYQGRLTDAGSPANGSYDLQFALFDAAGGGTQVGPTVTREDAVVTGGLFTVSLDFGAVFTGSRRWLEVAVRPGASTGAYTPLAGRQELTPSPNALFSSVAPWAGISGKPAGFADDVDNDSGGDITAVAAGTGLTGGGTAGAVSLGVDLGGSGSASTVARSDHDHFAQSWSGSSANGLQITNAAGAAVRGLSTATAGGPALYGEATGSQGYGVHGHASSSTAGAFPFGVLGTSALGVGVFGQSTSGIGMSGYATSATGFTTGVGGISLSSDGNGVWGQAGSTTGFAIGVRGETASTGGIGVWGYATPTAAGGSPTGVEGRSDSPTGVGVHGFAAASSGANVGVRGVSLSPAGLGGYFENTAGGPALAVSGGVGINTNTPSPGGLTIAPPGKLTFGSTTRQMIDLQSSAYGIGSQGGVMYFRTELPAGMFSWFLGGSHSNTQNDPGPGGTRQMRLDGAGNLFVRGAVSPGGADFAEMMPAGPGLEPGDVLAIGSDGQLERSTSPYQDTLAGVYSTKPGLVGGAADGASTDGKVPLAVAGIVPVKVTGEGGPIAPGDALTSSSTPGRAMKASKVRVGGIAFFPSGVVIGKALEAFEPATGVGVGVIEALVVLQ